MGQVLIPKLPADRFAGLPAAQPVLERHLMTAQAGRVERKCSSDQALISDPDILNLSRLRATQDDCLWVVLTKLSEQILSFEGSCRGKN